MSFLSHLVARRAGAPAARWAVETRILHWLRVDAAPQAVQWLSTGLCDLSCPHCYVDSGRRAHDELTTDEVRRLVVDELVALGCPLLVIAGGEASLRTDVPEIIEYAHRRGLAWAMHSHGAHLERLTEVIRRCPPALVAVSVDGPRAYHDAFRGRRGSFDAALGAIARLRALGCRETVAGTTVTRGNADLLHELAPIILDSGADSWGLHLVTPEGRAHGLRAELLPTTAQLRRVAGFARRLRTVLRVELDDEWGSADLDDCHYRDQTFACGAGRLSCVVGPTGEVLPCTTADVRESQGNVRTRPLRHLWARRFEAFRRGSGDLRADVSECWLQARNGNGRRRETFASGSASAGGHA